MNRVYELRKQAGMTQEEFSEFCGISKISITRYETGNEVSRANAMKIAKACNVSVSYVLGDENEPEDLGDAWAIRERLRRDPAYKMLFDASKNASPEHLRAAAAMLKALEGDKDD